MAGTVTISEETHGTVRKIKFEWIADGSGNADGTTVNAFSGEILRLVTVPGLSGDQPDDDYDVAINDEDSTDVLMGAGVDRDESDTEQVLASSLGIVANDKLSVSVSGAGPTNTGTVYLYLR